MVSWQNWCLFHCASPARWHSVFITSYYFKLQKWGCAQVRLSHGLPVGTPLVRNRPFMSMSRPGKSKQDRWKPSLLLVCCFFFCFFFCLFAFFFGIALDTQKRRLRASKTVTNCCNARLTYWGSQQLKFVNAIFEVLYACAERSQNGEQLPSLAMHHSQVS